MTLLVFYHLYAFKDPDNFNLNSSSSSSSRFEGAPGYSETRMTWTKANFLWMMYRSNWGRRANQTRILGIWLKLDAFHLLLKNARKTIDKGLVGKHSKDSGPSTGSVTLQWDPDHTPNGEDMSKRALQIGVKNVSWWKTGEMFEGIIDMTPLVTELRVHATTKNGLYPQLFTPQEKLYMLPETIAQMAASDTTEDDFKSEASFFESHVSL
jgi:hypothetical protein